MAKRFAGHADDLIAADAAKDIHVWKRATFVGIGILAAFWIKLNYFSPPGPTRTELDYSFLAINRKPLPWGDGKTPLFYHIAGWSHVQGKRAPDHGEHHGEGAHHH